MNWRYAAAAACLLAAIGLGVIIYDPWGLFLGYIAYALATLTFILIVLAVRWIRQARLDRTSPH